MKWFNVLYTERVLGQDNDVRKIKDGIWIKVENAELAKKIAEVFLKDRLVGIDSIVEANDEEIVRLEDQISSL